MTATSVASRRFRALIAAAAALLIAGGVLTGSVVVAPATFAENDVRQVIALARGGANGPDQVVPADYQPVAPLPRHHVTSVAAVREVSKGHINRTPLDDNASRRIFDRYLNNLDRRRVHFLATDVAAFEQYRDGLDDALQEGDLDPAFAIYNIYRRRALERVEYETKLLAGGVDQFDFTLDDFVLTDRREAPWPASREALEHLWRLEVKSRALSGKLAGESMETLAKTLAKRTKNRLRAIRQTRSEDVFRIYVNSFTTTYDRHTQYFSPRESEDFNISMSLSLEGIGAVLELEDDYTVVRRLVRGGPADRAGELRPADRIVAVSQSAKEPFVDIVGWRTDDVVQLIRGPKGSPVLLKIIPAGADASATRIVEIVRNVVKLEDQSVAKAKLNVDQNGRRHRIGVINVPTFYLDFAGVQAGDPNAKSTTRDVARLIDELKAEGIDALIVDVRNNGGGSLQEAVDLTGLFMREGPVVQVSQLHRPQHRKVFYDTTDGVAAWDGPLAVMVNQLSASASEIFAGAIQDHGRGVVVGDRTFGKGTVQMLLDLHRGQLKLTRQQFYRVSGEGTEQNGVRPDIAFPLLRFPTRAIDPIQGAITLPGDRVPAADYVAVNAVTPMLDSLRERHETRAGNNPEFAYLRGWREHTERLRERDTLSLNEAERLAEKQTHDQRVLELENQRFLAQGEEPVKSLTELEQRRRTKDLDDASPDADPLVRETANILIDYIELSQQGLARTDPPTPQPAWPATGDATAN